MELPLYLPITSDYGFKVTFGNPHNTEFLRRALQALIRSEVPIREVTLEPTNFAGLTQDSRSAIFDMSCVDERGRQFIVEMQVAHSPHFLQRLKFYAFHKLNTLIQRGTYDWGSLPPIYCIALLSKGILPGDNYHTLANLRTEAGELLDAQLTFVLAELDKFHLPQAAVHTDLEKLLFTMQNVENPLLDLENRPDFWEESWLQAALHELNTRSMPPEKYEQISRSLARRASILQQEQDWANAWQEAIAAKEQAAAAQQEAAAAQQEAVIAQQEANFAKESAVIAQQKAADAQQETAAAKEYAATAQAQLALVKQEVALAQQAAEQQIIAAAQAMQNATVRNLLTQGRFTIEEIASICGITPEQVQRLQPE